MVTGEFILTFEDPFWIGLFLRCDETGCYAARHIFGAEPTYPEVRNFLLHGYDSLSFLSISSIEMENLILREGRQSRRQVRKGSQDKGIPRSLNMYKTALQGKRKAQKAESTKRSQDRKKDLYLLKCEKRRQKKKGR